VGCDGVDHRRSALHDARDRRQSRRRPNGRLQAVAIESTLNTVTDALGPVDVLVNNAGIGFHADVLTLDE